MIFHITYFSKFQNKNWSSEFINFLQSSQKVILLCLCNNKTFQSLKKKFHFMFAVILKRSNTIKANLLQLVWHCAWGNLLETMCVSLEHKLMVLNYKSIVFDVQEVCHHKAKINILKTDAQIYWTWYQILCMNFNELKPTAVRNKFAFSSSNDLWVLETCKTFRF